MKSRKNTLDWVFCFIRCATNALSVLGNYSCAGLVLIHGFYKQISVCLVLKMRPLKHHREKELVLLLRQGDKTAFDELYFRYVPRLMAFANKYLHNNEEAEEAVQEIFIRVWEKRKSLDEEKNFKSYLFQSIKNYFLNLIRDRKSTIQLSEIPEEMHSSSEDILDTISYEELERSALALIASLPKVQREVFTLSRMEGLSNPEIALRLNLSKRTVEHHLYLSVKYLKSKLSQKETFYSVLLLIFYT